MEGTARRCRRPLCRGGASVPALPGHPRRYSREGHPNVIDRPNRYDMLIVITMEESALPLYDACDAHHHWKDAYGPLIEKKAIFDCE